LDDARVSVVHAPLPLAFVCRLKRKKKTTRAVKTTPHIDKGKCATLVLGTVKFLHYKGIEKDQWGSGGLQA
jgi:hypothetical protein